jgi:uncharacterized protein YjhX (UPF0386 family)
MDEMGHQEFADAPIKTAFIPADARDKQVYYPVSRTGKRITLIACIAADGSYLKPALIIARKTFDDELVDYGYTPEKLDIISIRRINHSSRQPYSKTGSTIHLFRKFKTDSVISGTQDEQSSLWTTAQPTKVKPSTH